MSGKYSRRGHLLALTAVLAATTAVAAAPTNTVYAIRGPGAEFIWQAGDGTQGVLVTFSDLAVQQANAPQPGPRVTFSITRLYTVNGALVRQQWYGDAALEARELTVGGGLGEATLDAMVTGTLLVQNQTGTTTTPSVPGRLQVRWTANGPTATNTTALVQQIPPYSMSLQAAGQGRTANVTGTLTVSALGNALKPSGAGSILSPNSGRLQVTLE